MASGPSMCQDGAMRWNRKTILQRWLTWAGLTGLVIVSMGVGWFAYNSVYALPGGENVAAPKNTINVGRESKVTAVFIGDEFSTQRAVELGGTLWTSEVARVNNWGEKNWSATGMGFVHKPKQAECKTSDCGNILEQVPRIVAENPRVVFIAAGTSDVGETPADVASSINSVFGALKIALPSARIVAIGPAAVDAIPKPEIVAIDGLIRSASKEMGATYISLLSPKILDDSMVSSNNEILSPSGHKAISTRVIDAL